MRTIIETKNLELTQALKDFAEKKFLGLEKFIESADIFVELEKETRHHSKGKIFVAKAQVQLPGKILMAVSREDDMYKAIVDVEKEMKLEIEKYKFKKIDKNRREQRKSKEKIGI